MKLVCLYPPHLYRPMTPYELLDRDDPLRRNVISIRRKRKNAKWRRRHRL